jgi:hypothetical protein
MIDQQHKQQIAVLLDNTFKKVEDFGEDLITTSEIETLIRTNVHGCFLSIPEVNTLLEGFNFKGNTITPTADKLWYIVRK